MNCITHKSFANSRSIKQSKCDVYAFKGVQYNNSGNIVSIWICILEVQAICHQTPSLYNLDNLKNHGKYPWFALCCALLAITQERAGKKKEMRSKYGLNLMVKGH